MNSFHSNNLQFHRACPGRTFAGGRGGHRGVSSDFKKRTETDAPVRPAFSKIGSKSGHWQSRSAAHSLQHRNLPMSVAGSEADIHADMPLGAKEQTAVSFAPCCEDQSTHSAGANGHRLSETQSTSTESAKRHGTDESGIRPPMHPWRHHAPPRIIEKRTKTDIFRTPSLTTLRGLNLQRALPRPSGCVYFLNVGRLPPFYPARARGSFFGACV